MRSPKYHLYLTPDERHTVINSLIDMRNNLISQGKYTDIIDELLIRACLKNDKTHKEADLFPQSCVIFSRNTPSMPSKKCLVLRKNLSLLCILLFIKQALV